MPSGDFTGASRRLEEIAGNDHSVVYKELRTFPL